MSAETPVLDGAADGDDELLAALERELRAERERGGKVYLMEQLGAGGVLGTAGRIAGVDPSVIVETGRTAPVAYHGERLEDQWTVPARELGVMTLRHGRIVTTGVSRQRQVMGLI